MNRVFRVELSTDMSVRRHNRAVRLPMFRAIRTDRRGVLLLLVLIAGLLVACSNRQLYSAIRENRLQECETYPVPQQAECRARYQMDYEEYERLREEPAHQAGSGPQEGRTEKR